MTQEIIVCRKDNRLDWEILSREGDRFMTISIGNPSLESLVENALKFLEQRYTAAFTFSQRTGSEIRATPYALGPPTLEDLTAVDPGSDIVVMCPEGLPTNPNRWHQMWRDPTGEVCLLPETTGHFMAQTLSEQIRAFFTRWTFKELARADYRRELFVRPGWQAVDVIPEEFPALRPMPVTPPKLKERNDGAAKLRASKKQMRRQLASQHLEYNPARRSWSRPQ